MAILNINDGVKALKQMGYSKVADMGGIKDYKNQECYFVKPFLIGF